MSLNLESWDLISPLTKDKLRRQLCLVFQQLTSPNYHYKKDTKTSEENLKVDIGT